MGGWEGEGALESCLVQLKAVAAALGSPARCAASYCFHGCVVRDEMWTFLWTVRIIRTVFSHPISAADVHLSNLCLTQEDSLSTSSGAASAITERFRLLDADRPHWTCWGCSLLTESSGPRLLKTCSGPFRCLDRLQLFLVFISSVCRFYYSDSKTGPDAGVDQWVPTYFTQTPLTESPKPSPLPTSPKDVFSLSLYQNNKRSKWIVKLLFRKGKNEL